MESLSFLCYANYTDYSQVVVTIPLQVLISVNGPLYTVVKGNLSGSGHHQVVKQWHGPISTCVFYLKLYTLVNGAIMFKEPVYQMLSVPQMCHPHISSISLLAAHLTLWP